MMNSIINENILINKKDIEYKFDEFRNGDLNIALVIGFSGSGKSTLGRQLSNGLSNCENCELDFIISPFLYSEEMLNRECGSLLSFFKSKSGRKYNISVSEARARIHDTDSFDMYAEPLLRDFLAYAEEYASKHKKTKFVINGVWPLTYNYKPEEFKDWCVMIKGTSLLTSSIRATKREVPSEYFLDRIKFFVNYIDHWTMDNKHVNSLLDEWNKYFNNLTPKEAALLEIYDNLKNNKFKWDYIDAPYFTESEIDYILNEHFHRINVNHFTNYHTIDPSNYRNKIKEIQELIKNTEDPKEITRLKMELIKLGWNPEVEVSESNISKAKDRIIRLYTEEMDNTCDIIDFSNNLNLYESYISDIDNMVYIKFRENNIIFSNEYNRDISEFDNVYSFYCEDNHSIIESLDYNVFIMDNDYRAMKVARDIINTDNKFILNKLK